MSESPARAESGPVPRTPVLVLDAVGKSFSTKAVLGSARLELHAGEIVLLVGRNGAGKTTLFRIACGALAPDHGLVVFRGVRHLRPARPALAREGLMYLPDRSIFFRGPSLGSQLRGAARRLAPEAPDETLERAVEALGLGDLLPRNPARLSGGEGRRANLALALLARPACLLLDEPFRGIAPLDVERITRLLRALVREGCALALTGHELGHVMEVAERIVWVHSGTAVSLGTPEEALAHHPFRRQYAPGFLGRPGR